MGQILLLVTPTLWRSLSVVNRDTLKQKLFFFFKQSFAYEQNKYFKLYMKKDVHPPAFPLEINERRKELFETEALYYSNCICCDKGNSSHLYMCEPYPELTSLHSLQALLA